MSRKKSEATRMWDPESYLFDISEAPARLVAAHAGRVFDAAWRTDFSAPGFCVLDLGPAVGSHDLRSLMLDLKDRLDEAGARRRGVRFAYRSLGRFDQRETTKFHLDGAPDRSLLMLGYEPSRVRGRLSLADYSLLALDMGIEPKRFLDEFNPMYRKGEELLAGYVSELPRPAEGHSRIVLLNNSSLPFTEARRNPLGVLHKAEILDPDESQRRVINSIMLATADIPGTEEVGEEQRRRFVETEAISEKFRG